MHRITQGVLVLPPTLEQYRRGRPRHALRTNVRRAEALGLRCLQLSGAEERQAYAGRAFFTAPWERRQLLDRPDRACWLVVDAGDEPIGLATLTVDADVAVLWSLTCRTSPARWLLHTRIVETLVAAGVRLLLTDSPGALQLEAGQQYFQQVLGYRVVHLTLRDAGRGPRRRGARRRA